MNISLYKVTALLLCASVVAGCNSDSKLNSPPILGANSFVTETDVAITDRLAVQDPDGDMLTFSLVTQPKNGSVTLSTEGNFTYTPQAEFTGDDSFVISVSDGDRTVQGQIWITVNVATVSFLSYSRTAFSQPQDARPLAVNGRNFSADASAQADYADLLTGQ
jgi:hypothetical protein